MRYIVDLSHYQVGINIAQIEREGFTGCIVKATEGTTYVDPQYATFMNAIKKTGLIKGAYHFLRSNSGTVQARHFYDQVKKMGGPNGFICVCDNESDATFAATQAFFNEWNRLTNNHPLMMYSGAWWWKPRGWNGVSLTPYLWNSHYVSGNGYASVIYQSVPSSYWTPGYGGWHGATMLQFSSTALVAGKHIDVSAVAEQFALETLTMTPTSSSSTAPTPTVPVVSEEVKGMAGIIAIEGRPERFFTDGIRSWHILNENDFEGVKTLSNAGIYPPLGNGGGVWQLRADSIGLLPPIVGPVPSGYESRGSDAATITIGESQAADLVNAIVQNVTEIFASSVGVTKDGISDIVIAAIKSVLPTIRIEV